MILQDERYLLLETTFFDFQNPYKTLDQYQSTFHFYINEYIL